MVQRLGGGDVLRWDLSSSSWTGIPPESSTESQPSKEQVEEHQAKGVKPRRNWL